MKKIIRMSNHELLSHLMDAICDRNYNPSSEDYNQSGYSFYELESEVLRRMRSEGENNTESEN